MKRNPAPSIGAPVEPDELVPDTIVARELGGASKMQMWRFTNDVSLGFPVLVKVGRKNHRWRSEVEAFKARLTAKALAERNKQQQKRAAA